METIGMVAQHALTLMEGFAASGFQPTLEVWDEDAGWQTVNLTPFLGSTQPAQPPSND